MPDRLTTPDESLEGYLLAVLENLEQELKRQAFYDPNNFPRLSFTLFRDGYVGNIHIQGVNLTVNNGHYTLEALNRCVPFPEFPSHWLEQLDLNLTTSNQTVHLQASRPTEVFTNMEALRPYLTHLLDEIKICFPEIEFRTPHSTFTLEFDIGNSGSVKTPVRIFGYDYASPLDGPAAINAIKAAGPFPKLPDACRSITVKLTVTEKHFKVSGYLSRRNFL